MKRIFFLAAVSCLFQTITFSQGNTVKNKYPEVGRPCPEFILNEVQYHSKSKVSWHDFKGKWLVLDFWHRYCSSCIESLPKIDSFRRRFAGQVQFLMVGYTGSQFTKHPDDELIRKDYEKYRKKFNLGLSVAFDSTLFHRFNIYGCPYVVIVDPQGIVRGITYKLTAENIERFLAGDQPRLPKAWRKGENTVTYNDSLPFLINGNGGYAADYIYRSLLTPFKEYMDGDFRFRIINNRLQIIGAGLSTLYRYAYLGVDYLDTQDSLYGIFYPGLILEIADSGIFFIERDLRTNMFCYSIEFPASRSDKASVMKMMQRDLKNYFGYEVIIETRKMPVWNLVQAGKAVAGTKPIRDQPAYKYQSIKGLLGLINSYNADTMYAPIIDCTGLKGEVIGELSCNIQDINDVRRSLHENGFDLLAGEKEMKVIVVKDAKE